MVLKARQATVGPKAFALKMKELGWKKRKISGKIYYLGGRFKEAAEQDNVVALSGRWIPKR
jgi:hypothetical protein